jgi:hypothetical protein
MVESVPEIKREMHERNVSIGNILCCENIFPGPFLVFERNPFY